MSSENLSMNYIHNGLFYINSIINIEVTFSVKFCKFSCLRVLNVSY